MPKPKAIYGTQGIDLIPGTSADENIYSYEGDDVVHGGGGSDFIQGGTGEDQVFGDDGDDRMVDGGAGTDRVHGGNGNDTVSGMEGNDFVFGDAGNDRVIGHTGDDYLNGGDGNDTIIGEWGRDELWGGSGADVFQFGWGADSTTRTDWYPADLDSEITYGVDQIMDFESGVDKIDLSRIDANLTTEVLPPRGKSGAPTGNEAFQIVNAPQTGEPSAGQMTVTYDASSNTTTIMGYMDNQQGADFTLFVAGEIIPTADLIL